MAELEGVEHDYLVRAQLAIDPDGFAECVREAFRCDHDCVEKQDIAEVLGQTKGSITHLFEAPERVEAKTIRKLLSHLSSPYHKKRVFDAWVRAAFGEEVKKSKGPVVGTTISTATVKRVDRYFRESRYAVAAEVASEAASKTADLVLRWRLQDRAFFARHRLDQMGHAMDVARTMCAEAREQRNPWRFAHGLLCRARVLESMPGTSPEEAFRVFDEAELLLSGATPLSEAPQYATATLERIRSARLSVRVTYMERGALPIDEPMLRQELTKLLVKIKRTRSRRPRFMAAFFASRIHLLLGESFQARELMDTAFAAGGLKNLNLFELLSIMQSRVTRATGEAEEGIEAALKLVSANCLAVQNRYHSRVAEWELAAFEHERFPSFMYAR